MRLSCGARRRIKFELGLMLLLAGTLAAVLLWRSRPAGDAPFGAVLFEWRPGQYVQVLYGQGSSNDIDASRLNDPGTKNAAVLLPALDKGDIFRGVVLGGVLPRKAFSMGHAEEKRYYIECRSLVS